MTSEPGINPKEAIGATKDPLHLLPPTASAATARVLKFGAERYSPWNWRHTRVNATTYVAAMRRHLDRWLDGEDIDPESGESHIAHVAASCNIMLDAEAFGNLADDRPPKLKKTEPN